MSAFAVVYDCSGEPADAGMLADIMERLSHRGPDGRDGFVLGRVAMGHWHFWTTPEEVGERQPLRVKDTPFVLVFDGRIDNREEILAALPMPGRDDLVSDAVLVIRAYEYWGSRCVERFVGEFAFVLFDERDGTLFCARDPLGDRTLFYSRCDGQVLIASEPWPLASAHRAQPEPDEQVIAHFFALRARPVDRTIFKNVFELPPAHTLVVDANVSPRSACYWQPDFSRIVRYTSDDEYADHFRAVLEESVRCRMRATTPVGVMMSGGLDSTSIACLAARSIAPQRLMTFSYVFDELLECDERAYIHDVQEKWNTLAFQFACDDAWPFKDVEHLPVNPNYPSDDAFKALIERTYAQANRRGVRVLLSGMFADHMFRGGTDWLADLLLERRFFDAARQIFLHRGLSLRTILQKGFLQRAARRILNLFPGGKSLRRHRTWPEWLTETSITHLSACVEERMVAKNTHDSILGSSLSQASSSEIYYASRNAVDVRYPFRDRRLVELVLAMPAYQLYFQATNKYILRNSMRAILPESVRLRAGKTHYLSLLFRGTEREKAPLMRYLYQPGLAWTKFLRGDWLERQIQESQGVNLVLAWVCLSYEIWRNHTHIYYGDYHVNEKQKSY